MTKEVKNLKTLTPKIHNSLAWKSNVLKNLKVVKSNKLPIVCAKAPNDKIIVMAPSKYSP